MRKNKRRRISDFTNFAPEFVEDFTNETPKDINLRNYLDEEDQRDIALTDLENELKQKENEETMRVQKESINNNDDVAQAAQYVKELLWEFGDEIRKEIEVDKYNNLSVLIRPKYERISTLEDAKTGLAIRIGEEFVDRLMSIAIMINDLKLTNIFEITWVNITEKGIRTRRKTHVEKKHIPKMIKVLKDKPIYQVRITAGNPLSAKALRK
jgi:hypothetical protein